MSESNSTTSERSKSYRETWNEPQRQHERDCSGRSKPSETVAGTVRAMAMGSVPAKKTVMVRRRAGLKIPEVCYLRK